MDLNQTKNLSTDEEPKARWCHYPRPTRSGGRGKSDYVVRAHGEGECVVPP